MNFVLSLILAFIFSVFSSASHACEKSERESGSYIAPGHSRKSVTVPLTFEKPDVLGDEGDTDLDQLGAKKQPKKKTKKKNKK